MFQLLQPIWLFASAAIAIPILIHLWNIREGKTLQVGSILLLQESARQQARSLKLKDILLLILRCLLIIIVAFLLAKPIWQKQLTLFNEKGWILIEKQSLAEAYNQNKVTIDSLIKAGCKFHYFNKNFKPDDLAEALKKPVDTAKENELSYWTLLKQLNEEVPAELPVYLFTDDKLRRFAGTRPQVSINLKWKIFTSQDTIAKQFVKAYKTASGNIRSITANSKPAATFYTFESSKKLTDIKADTSTLRITIYTDQFATDGTYIKAAIDAIQQYTGLQIKTLITNNKNDIKHGNDWLFWLSEKPFPKQDVATNIFAYERGKEQQVNSFISVTNNSEVNQELVHVSRIFENNMADNNEVLWRDGFGHAILCVEKNVSSIYHFYSRFNPDWNDLPWRPLLVEMICKLLFKDDISINDFDKRIIDATQIQPVISETNKAFDKQKFVETIDLTKLFWIIAFVIFCIERYISLTANKQEAYA